MPWVLGVDTCEETCTVARAITEADAGLRLATSPDRDQPAGVMVCSAPDGDRLEVLLARCASFGVRVVVVTTADSPVNTGAVGTRTGACAAANGGRLFLDEIGELSVELQPALLRVVQEGTYKRVGADTWQHSSFRLICATNRPLEDEVAAGRFRADLYHRIAAGTVTLPPLSERSEDIVALFRPSSPTRSRTTPRRARTPRHRCDTRTDDPTRRATRCS